MKNKVERALVQGTVTFTVSCNVLSGLVEPDVANNGGKLKEWLQDKAFKLIDSADAEVEIDYVDDVKISLETANLYTNKIICNEQWKDIKREDKEDK